MESSTTEVGLNCRLEGVEASLGCSIDLGLKNFAIDVWTIDFYYYWKPRCRQKSEKTPVPPRLCNYDLATPSTLSNKHERLIVKTFYKFPLKKTRLWLYWRNIVKKSVILSAQAISKIHIFNSEKGLCSHSTITSRLMGCSNTSNLSYYFTVSLPTSICWATRFNPPLSSWQSPIIALMS